ncbi:hypothetical protein NLM33_35840 [Bradyrhizobium sp. CCGUVB1N3]|uniref:hypothetical protein n=1 Tax=Bradyrhizobium sp. CCGUVB1N3 TaxID=2949629 RepID=UPI0020B1FAE1|nr:hypothetical protein [Bradyrhizobium sp. CCGUVB1N3]MCP3475648.1 hypothetical protein [Bradyrhizobium sp. CCGUVB1N3]
MNDLIVTAFNNVLDREAAEQAEIREEIRRHGTCWAAREIWSLRRQVRALRKRLESPAA